MSRIQALDTSVDVLKSLLWEHDGADKLVQLTRLKQEWYEKNQSEFWTDWIRDVFNIRTANQFGLAVWGRILDVPMQVTSAPDVGKFAFGFGSNNANFENGNFGNKNSNTIGLTVDQQRLIIRLRYFKLTARGTVPETNRFLKKIFTDVGQGRVFVADPYDMSFVTYFFEQAPDSSTQFILDHYDLLPRPAGVGIKYQVQPRPSFGFGPNHLNFENGNFGA
jgi:hypothetical protein